MVVFSSLRTVAGGAKNLVVPFRNGTQGAFKSQIVPARQMGGGAPKMRVIPSNFEWNQWKDDVHYYVMLGLIPIAIVVVTVNTFIGKAELVDIPEGYEPKHWEYYQHPISRAMSKYIFPPPEKHYEKQMHLINMENEKRKLRLLENKVSQLMGTRGDYKGWYYVPTGERRVYIAREQLEDRKMLPARGGTS